MEMVSPNYVWITMHGPRDLLSQSEKSCSKNVNRALNASFSLKIDPYPNITANEWLETGQVPLSRPHRFLYSKIIFRTEKTFLKN